MKCPHCEAAITGLDGGLVKTTIGDRLWKTVVFSCQKCHKALGCEIDPIALQADTIKKIVDGLSKRDRSR